MLVYFHSSLSLRKNFHRHIWNTSQIRKAYLISHRQLQIPTQNKLQSVYFCDVISKNNVYLSISRAVARRVSLNTGWRSGHKHNLVISHETRKFRSNNIGFHVGSTWAACDRCVPWEIKTLLHVACPKAFLPSLRHVRRFDTDDVQFMALILNDTFTILFRITAA